LADNEALRGELENAKTHLNQMRQISKDNERRISQILEMRKKEMEELNAEVLPYCRSCSPTHSAAQLAACKTQEEVARADVADKRKIMMEQLKDMDEQREKSKQLETELRAQIASKETELTLATQALEDARSQMNILQRDIDMYQKEARSAHTNYERELQVRVHAEQSLPLMYRREGA
jgi:hypothetical protein